MTITSPDASPPVFVYGALRSGTTVFRLMLNAHSGISNPGEVDFLFDFLKRDTSEAGGWVYDRQKLRENRVFRKFPITLPTELDGLALLRHMINELDRIAPGALTLNIHRNAEKIAAALPDARFIHLVRDPRDVARSAIGMGWVGTSYHGAHYWLEAEENWGRADIPESRVLSVSFEHLMSDLETELMRVCDFLTVPFSRDMLSYHENTTYDPPDPRIVQAWKRKASPREIALIEGRVGHLMEARGYQRHGTPHDPGPVERAILSLKNRFGRWRFNIRRFGLPLFVATHAARILHLTKLHRRLRLRQDAIVDRLVK